MRDPFLIDECLSPDLVALAHSRGFDATHVVFRGLAGTADHDLMPIIRNEDFVFVTNNARDFIRLYARQNIHPGLVIIVPGGITAEVQTRLFACVLDAIETMPDLVNRLVEVYSDGAVEVRDWPIGMGQDGTFGDSRA
jgi:predicted nuclease of predicted toxin-antitoxin system